MFSQRLAPIRLRHLPPQAGEGFLLAALRLSFPCEGGKVPKADGGALCRTASVYYQFDPYSSLELAIAIKPAVAVRVDEIPELSPALE
jgi:hypothetical protein